MNKKTRMIAGAALAGFAAVLGAGAHFSSDSQGGAETYQLDISGQTGEASLRLEFDMGTMTYVQTLESNGQKATIDSGSFALTEEGLQTFSETDDINSLRYIIDGECIFPEGQASKGGGPNEKTLYKKVK